MFDASAFARAKFQPRTAEVSLPALADFFPDSDPVWTVRGLTASEVAKSNEAINRTGNAKALLSAFESLSQSDKIAELRGALGLSDDVPGEISKRMEQLVAGSVSPEIKLDVAVKLAQYFPVEFYQLTNEIVKLTGMGAEAEKKPRTSGNKTKSGAL